MEPKHRTRAPLTATEAADVLQAVSVLICDNGCVTLEGGTPQSYALLESARMLRDLAKARETINAQAADLNAYGQRVAALTRRLVTLEEVRTAALKALDVVTFGVTTDANNNGGVVDRLAVVPYVEEASRHLHALDSRTLEG